MKSEIDTVIDDMEIKRIILFSDVKLEEELTDMVNKNPNKNPANVVNSALSLSIVP